MPKDTHVFYTSGLKQQYRESSISPQPKIQQGQWKYVQNAPSRYYNSQTRKQYRPVYYKQPQAQNNAYRKQFFLTPVRNTVPKTSVSINRRTTTVRSAVKKNTKRRVPVRMVFAK